MSRFAFTLALVGALALTGTVAARAAGTAMSHDTDGQSAVVHENMGHDSMGHSAMGHDTMGHDTMGHDTMGHGTMGHAEIGHGEQPASR